MATRALPRELGKYFSEGARLLWLEMTERQINPPSLAVLLGTNRGQITNWLYGARRASLEWALRIHEALGIPPGTWLEAPRIPFTPPIKHAA